MKVVGIETYSHHGSLVLFSSYISSTKDKFGDDSHTAPHIQSYYNLQGYKIHETIYP